MQITYLDQQQGADVLQESALIVKIEAPGSSVTYVLNRDGIDVLMFTDSVTGDCVVVEPDLVDLHRGGSIHDQARKVFWSSPSEGSEVEKHVIQE